MKELVNQPEGKTLEFKRDTSSPKNWLKTLVAFANSAGGKLVFGISNDRTVLGVASPLDEEERICNQIDIRNGTSRIRNNVIARVFREIRLIEQWGTGVRRIFAEAERHGLPEPRIEEMGMRLRFTVFLKEIIKVPEPSRGAQSGPESGLESGPESGLESGLESLADRILEGLLKAPLSKGSLAKHLGHTSISSTLNLRINQLLDLGFIERTIPDKPNSRLQKYRLTPKGKKLLEDRK